MLKKVTYFLCLFVFAFSSWGDIKDTAYQMAADFLANPQMFFLDLQYDSENNLPLMHDEDFELHTNLFLHLLTVANLNVKYRFYQGDNKFPSFTGGVGGWYFWGLNILPQIETLKEAKDISVFGVAPFVTAHWQVSETTFLFAGTKLSIGRISMDFTKVAQEQIKEEGLRNIVEKVACIKETYVDPAIFVGIAIEKFSLEAGYQFFAQRLFARFLYTGDTWGFGLGFYPDSVIILHPMINLSYRFSL